MTALLRARARAIDAVSIGSPRYLYVLCPRPDWRRATGVFISIGPVAWRNAISRVVIDRPLPVRGSTRVVRIEYEFISRHLPPPAATMPIELRDLFDCARLIHNSCR